MATSKKSQSMRKLFRSARNPTVGGFAESDEESGLGTSPTSASESAANEEKSPNIPTKAGSKEETDGNVVPSHSAATIWFDPRRIGPGDTVIPEHDIHLQGLDDEISGLTEELREKKEVTHFLLAETSGDRHKRKKDTQRDMDTDTETNTERTERHTGRHTDTQRDRNIGTGRQEQPRTARRRLPPTSDSIDRHYYRAVQRSFHIRAGTIFLLTCF